MPNATTSKYFLTTEEKLKHFIVEVLERSGVARAHAEVVAGVLVEADLRGIESHGVARLDSYYVGRIRSGHLKPQPNYHVVRETKTSIVFDGDNGLGHPVSKMAMEAVIAKAYEYGAAFGAVRNSNHYGIAGYYAMMSLDHDMIGMSSTNSVKYAAATFGREVTMGTNPFAFAVPTGNEPAFVLDFATTTVPKGKIEVHKRKHKKLEPGWAIDEQGNPTYDPDEALRGALLPLGGFGTEGGGHKGYGLGLLADIFCGVLSGGCFGATLPFADETKEGAISHWFGAFRVDGFRDVAEFKEDMDAELRYYKESSVAHGAQRIMVAGEPEILNAVYHRQYGIPVHEKIWDGLNRLAGELNIAFDLAK